MALPPASSSGAQTSPILVKWSQQGSVLVIRVFGGTARFFDDDTGEHTVMAVHPPPESRHHHGDVDVESFTLYGKLCLEDMMDRVVRKDSAVITTYAASVVNPWPRLLATRMKHPRVSVDWDAWSLADEDDDAAADGDDDVFDPYAMGSEI